MKTLFGQAEDEGAGPLYRGGVAGADEEGDDAQTQGTPQAGKKWITSVGLRGLFNSPLPTSIIASPSVKVVPSPSEGQKNRSTLFEMGRGFFNSPMPVPLRADNDSGGMKASSMPDPSPASGETEEEDNTAEVEEPVSPKVGKIQDTHRHLDSAIVSLRELEATLITELSLCFEADKKQALDDDLVKVRGQITGLEYMLESVAHVKSRLDESEKFSAGEGVDSPSSPSKKKRMGIVKGNVEGAMKKARKTILSVRKSIGAASAMAGSMKSPP